MAEPFTTPKRLRLPEAAAFLGCSRATLATPRWRTALGVPCFRLGRALVFDSSELSTWLVQRREGPRGTEAA